MSIGLQFTGQIDGPEGLLEAARELAAKEGYGLAAGENRMKLAVCPLGGVVNLYWKRGKEGWLVWGGCISTPAGAGFHRAAVELVDALPIRGLTVEDETGFYRQRDFGRMKEEHFNPWLRTLVEVCRQEDAAAVSGIQLCWALEQYAPESIPGTAVTPMGRFRLGELVELEEEGIQVLADRFFLWDGRTRDARFYRNRAVNTLWEQCCFLPSAVSREEAEVNASILNDLERAAKMDPALPLPRRAYREVCALEGRTPALPEGPELSGQFQPGYRRGLVTHAAGQLRLTLPGVCRRGWERWERGGGAHLWSGGGGPVWRGSAYQTREGEARFTSNLDTLHGVEGRKLKGGALRWGWRDVREEGQTLYQAQCEVITGPSLYLVTATCAAPEQLGQVADLIGRIQVVNSAARREIVQAQRQEGRPGSRPQK